jgi:HTH-type transcriptional regulator, competence development regulator
MNRFGQKVRKLRQGKGLSLRELAPKVGVGFTYLSKVETGRLDFGDYPGEALIRKLAKTLDADADELLILAEKVPDRIRKRVLERPDAFGRFAELDDKTIDKLLAALGDDGAIGPG